MVPDYKHRNGKWACWSGPVGGQVLTVSGSLYSNMKARCKDITRNPSYSGCEILFGDFQDFADWHTQQVGYGLGYHLDKDILSNGAKIYSRENCALIPQALNNFLCTPAKLGGCPQGVRKSGSKYISTISLDSVSTYLGTYCTLEQAHSAYKVAKKGQALVWADRLETYYSVNAKVPEALRKMYW